MIESGILTLKSLATISFLIYAGYFLSHLDTFFYVLWIPDGKKPLYFISRQAESSRVYDKHVIRWHSKVQ